MSLFRSGSIGLIAAANESVGSFLPSDLGALELWLDASDAATIHATAGAVNTWDDKSSHTRNATAATTARPTTGTRTMNSLNSLDFDGAANRMTTGSFSLSQSFTVCAAVLNDSGANATQQIFVADITNQRSVNKGTNNKWSLFDGNSLDSSLTADTSAHAIVGLFKAPSLAVIRVGATETTGNCGSGSWGGGISIGASNAANWWNGMISELFIYSDEKNATERATIVQYFHDKWGT